MYTEEHERGRWERRARAVTILRDDWGIAHIRGRTDADTVFGLMYAQAEDDFNRVESNCLGALGRAAEAEGESAIYKDLRVRLFVTTADLKERYAASPAWLQKLMQAWAEGLNYFLAVHPEVMPRVIERFEPWMALSFVEGGVLGDIASVTLAGLEEFYGAGGTIPTQSEVQCAVERSIQESSGSNAFAIAPSHTSEGSALLLINPHPEFYFRSEVHLYSEQGLNCYGAVTWGQFFVFQGFNERLGWGHTTSGADTVDEYAETVLERHGHWYYRYGDAERQVEVSTISIPYRASSGGLAHRIFTVYRTHHGPIVRQLSGQWISVALMHKPVEALTQSVLRMKARSYQEFVEAGQFKANSVANAVYADADGNIAYFHPQFVPRRDDRFDFTQPVDGADPHTAWRGEHELDELPHVFNPPNGWIVNTNNAAYWVAGADSPKARDFPSYMDTAGQNPRGVNAARVLQDRKDFTLSSLIEAAYDPYLHAFAQLIPSLVAAYDQLPASDTRKQRLVEQIAMLRNWDYRYSVSSTATSLAVLWGEQMLEEIEPILRTASIEIASMFDYLLRSRMSATVAYRALSAIHDRMVEDASASMKLDALIKVCGGLVRDFGTWQLPWGEIHRFQRLSGQIVQQFDDELPSTPMALVSSVWGALASCKSRRGANTKRYYATSGNGFVLAVQFGPRVRALAISAGGASANPQSAHFNDQGARLATGDLRDVYFYPDELEKHTERSYHPGQRGHE